MRAPLSHSCCLSFVMHIKTKASRASYPLPSYYDLSYISDRQPRPRSYRANCSRLRLTSLSSIQRAFAFTRQSVAASQLPQVSLPASSFPMQIPMSIKADSYCSTPALATTSSHTPTSLQLQSQTSPTVRLSANLQHSHVDSSACHTIAALT